MLNIAQSGNYNRALNTALRDSKFTDAMNAAEHLVRYDPLTASRHVTLGFVSYLAGHMEQSLKSFARAKELTLPAQFKTAWDSTSGNAAYARVLSDTEFVAKVTAAK